MVVSVVCLSFFVISFIQIEIVSFAGAFRCHAPICGGQRAGIYLLFVPSASPRGALFSLSFRFLKSWLALT